MANTWTAFFPEVAFSENKVMAGLVNTGARVLRIRRIRMLNTQVATIAGQICYGELRRYTSATWVGPSATTPFAHDTTSGALVNTSCGYGGTPGGTLTLLRNYIWSSDESAAGGTTIDEWETISPFNVLWELGFGDATLTSLTVRTNEMVCVYNVSGSTGAVDLWITFTDEAA